MAELPKKHLEINRKFNAGHFSVQKTKRVFSAIPIDQAHEQNNASAIMKTFARVADEQLHHLFIIAPLYCIVINNDNYKNIQ